MASRVATHSGMITAELGDGTVAGRGFRSQRSGP